MSTSLLQMARSLAKKAGLLRPSTLKDISVQFVIDLYERICGPHLVDKPLMPSRPLEKIKTILEVLSCTILNADLNDVLRAEDILKLDAAALLYLLNLFAKIDAALNPQTSSTAIQDAKDSRERAKSVFYTPRTDLRRRIQARRAELQHQKSSRKSGQVKRHETPTKPKLSSSLYIRQEKAAENRQRHLTYEQTKAAIRNAVGDRRRLMIATKRAIDHTHRATIANRHRLDAVLLRTASGKKLHGIVHVRNSMTPVKRLDSSLQFLVTNEKLRKGKPIRGILSAVRDCGA